MTTYKIPTATNRQKQRIQTLTEEKGLPLNVELDGLGAFEASVIIDDLEDHTKNVEEKKKKTGIAQAQKSHVDNYRLGLAIKLVYNKWRYDVNGIVRDKNLKGCFIREVVELYKIMSDVMQTIEMLKEDGGLDA